MRRTLTIDDDVDALLERENKKAGEPMKQTVNRILRCGLSHASVPPKKQRFVVKPLDLGTTPEQWEQWRSRSVWNILEDAEGPAAR